MIRKCRCFYLLLYLSGCLLWEASAQTSKLEAHIRTLEARLATTRDTTKVNLYNEIAFAYRNMYPEKTLQFALEALRLGKRLQYHKGEAEAYRQIGIGHIVKGESVKALQNFLRGLEIAKQYNHKQIVANLQANVGRVYVLHRNFDEAIAYFQQSLRLNQELRNQQRIAVSMLNMGEVFLRLGKPQQALHYFANSLTINEKYSYDTANIITAKRFAAEVYLQQKNYQIAEKYVQEVITLCESIGNHREHSLALLTRAKLQMAANADTTQALQSALAAYQYASKGGIRDPLIQAEELLAKIYAALKDYPKAYHFEQLFHQRNDSLLNERAENQILSYRLTYEAQQRQAEIQVLNNERKWQRALLYVALVLIPLLVWFGLYMYRAYRDKLKINELLAIQKTEIEQKSHALLNQTKALSRLNDEINRQNQQILDAQKELQKLNTELAEVNNNLTIRVAQRTQRLRNLNRRLLLSNRELDAFIYRASHDFRQPIATLLGLLNIAEQETDPAELSKFISLIATVVHKADGMLFKMLQLNIINHRRPAGHLHRIDFAKVIAQVRDKLSSLPKAEHTTWQVEICSPLVDLHSDLDLIKIVLENVIENAIYFSHASRPLMLDIRVESKKRGVRIDIKDNGKGIAPEHLHKVFRVFFRGSTDSRGNGIGLYVVRKALEKLDGNIEIHSTENEYTHCIIHLADWGSTPKPPEKTTKNTLSVPPPK